MLSIFDRNRDFFDSFFDDFNPSPFLSRNTVMRTDVEETESAYTLSIELPGFDKDDVKVSLENGYLHIEVERHGELDDKQKRDRFIHKERYYGIMKRSFYVGNKSLDDIKGTFNKGILTLEVPKEKQQLHEKRYLELK